MAEVQTKQRSKDLTSIQLQRLRKLPQYLHLSSNQFVLYNLVEKSSNSGLFKNERLLILNVKQEYLCYLSKVPPGLIPFQSEEEVNAQQSKEKLSTNEIYENGENKASCKMVPDKNGLEIKLNKNDRKIELVFYFSSKQLAEEWFHHVNFIFTRPRQEIDLKYHVKIIDNQNSSKFKEVQKASIIKEQKNQPLKSQIQSKKGRNPQINDSIQIQEIKKPAEQRQSEFNQFSQHMPLGKFVREDKKYNTQISDERNQMGNLYFTSPNSLIPKRQNSQNYRNNEKRINDDDLPILKQDVRSIINHNQVSDTLKKQNVRDPYSSKQSYEKQLSFRSKLSNLKTADWNANYYSNKESRSTIYFEFIKECIKFTTQMVDILPITKAIQKLDKHEEYYYCIDKGIAYKIAYNTQDESLIYELSENSPIVYSNYDVYDDLKAQFYQQRRLFFNSQQQSPLICYIEYKGLSFLCKASKSQNPITKTNKSFKRSNINEDALLKKMENMQLFIVSTSDFNGIMRYLNTPALNWSYLYHQTQVKQFKVQFLNQIFSDIFVNIIKGQLCHTYTSGLFDQLKKTSILIIQEAVSDSILMLLNRLFGKGNETDQLWDIIFQEVQRKFKIQASMENVVPGYLLYSVIFKLGIKVKKNINMKQTFLLFKKNVKAIEKQNVSGFKPIVHYLNYQHMSPLFQQIKENLQSSHQNNQQLELLIGNEQYESIPAEINHLASKVNIQLSKTNPYSLNGQNILIYQSMITDTPTEDNYEIVLSAISWLLQAQRHNEAFDLAFIKIEELFFWTGKVPIISLFYDSFAEYFIAHDEVEKAIEQLKLSIKTLSQIFGTNCDKLLRKKYDLSSYYLSLNRKDESLKELSQCKSLCESQSYEQSSIYVKILNKMAKLNLSMSKFNDSINLSMACLKSLQQKVEQEQIFQSESAANQFLQVGELLLRAFELTNRREELFQITSLCADRCLNIDSLKAYKRLFRMILFPYLKRLSLHESQAFLMIIQELNTGYKQSNLREQQLYECIKERKLLVDINSKMKNYFKNIVKLHDEIIKKKLLEDYLYSEDQYFLSKGDKNQVEQFIKETFLITNLIGIGFVQGMLKDVYYD